jgi:hypothetical protein
MCLVRELIVIGCAFQLIYLPLLQHSSTAPPPRRCVETDLPLLRR